MTSLELGIWVVVILAGMIFMRLGRLINVIEQGPSHIATTQIENSIKETNKKLGRLISLASSENTKEQLEKIDSKMERLLLKQ